MCCVWETKISEDAPNSIKYDVAPPVYGVLDIHWEQGDFTRIGGLMIIYASGYFVRPYKSSFHPTSLQLQLAYLKAGSVTISTCQDQMIICSLPVLRHCSTYILDLLVTSNILTVVPNTHVVSSCNLSNDAFVMCQMSQAAINILHIPRHKKAGYDHLWISTTIMFGQRSEICCTHNHPVMQSQW